MATMNEWDDWKVILFRVVAGVVVGLFIVLVVGVGVMTLFRS